MVSGFVHDGEECLAGGFRYSQGRRAIGGDEDAHRVLAAGRRAYDLEDEQMVGEQAVLRKQPDMLADLQDPGNAGAGEAHRHGNLPGGEVPQRTGLRGRAAAVIGDRARRGEQNADEHREPSRPSTDPQ